MAKADRLHSEESDFTGPHDILQATRYKPELLKEEAGIAAILVHLLPGPKTLSELESNLRKSAKKLKQSKAKRFSHPKQLNFLLSKITLSSDCRLTMSNSEILSRFKRSDMAAISSACDHERRQRSRSHFIIPLLEKRCYDKRDLRKKQYEIAWWGKALGIPDKAVLYYLIKASSQNDSRINLQEIIDNVKEYSYTAFYLILLEVVYEYARWIVEDFKSFKQFVKKPIMLDDVNTKILKPEDFSIVVAVSPHIVKVWDAADILNFLSHIARSLQRVVWKFSQKTLLRASFNPEYVGQLEQLNTWSPLHEAGSRQ